MSGIRGPLTLTLVLLLVGVLSAQTQAPAWPQWRGPARDGVASSFTPPAAWPAQLTKRWEAPVGAGHSSPVISGTRVVLHSRQANREVIAAYDLQSGKQLWPDGVDAPYTMNQAAIGHGPGPKSTPAVADGRVFTLGISGIFSAHDLATGKLLWRKPAPPTPPEFGTASSPMVDGGTVIAFLGGPSTRLTPQAQSTSLRTGTVNGLTAMAVATGAVKWQWAGDGPGYASPIIATFGGTRQIITQSQNALVGIDAAKGQLLWRVAIKTPYEQNSVTPVVIGDLLLYAGLENPTIALRITRTGTQWAATPAWRNEQVSIYMSSPAAVGTTVYGLSNKNRGQFFAIDAATGKTLWTTKGRDAENASIVRAGDYLLLGTTNSELIVVKANPARYEELKRYTVANSAMWAHPAFAGGFIVVKDVNTLLALSAISDRPEKR
ncbi:MAG: PQQ-like beta-propeller repeat protein [Vicinamibacterales bacterium]|nr:PQQ-like beta-propeller repeat protein [Vicinamibacterales bacterium]